MKTYSQKDEQDWILRHCGPVGRFLDIGAFDGVQYSNTMALVERGWEGIMVEPSMEAFKALHANHGNNPRIKLINAAVVAGDWSLVEFWPNPRTFSTTKRSNVDKFIHEGFSSPFYMGTVTVEEIIVRFPGPIDVLSIDTEGTSLELLWSVPLVIRPRVVVVEHDGDPELARAWAQANHYSVVMFNEENMIAADQGSGYVA